MELQPVPPTHWLAEADVKTCPICKGIFDDRARSKHHCAFCGRITCEGCSQADVETLDHGRHRACLDCIKAASVAQSPKNGGGSTSAAADQDPPAESAEVLAKNPYVEALEHQSNDKSRGLYHDATPASLSALHESVSIARQKRWLAHRDTLAKLTERSTCCLLQWWISAVTKSGVLNTSAPEVLRQNVDLIVDWCGQWSHYDPEHSYKKGSTVPEGYPFWSVVVDQVGLLFMMNARTKDGDTVLHGLARRDRFDHLKLVVDQCRSQPASTSSGEAQQLRDALAAAVQAQGKFGKSVLHCCIDALGRKWDTRAFDSLHLLLTLGADPNACLTAREVMNMMPCAGANPLMYLGGITVWYDSRIPDELLKYGIDVRAVDKNGATALVNLSGNHLSGDTVHGAELAKWLLDRHCLDTVRAHAEDRRRYALHLSAFYGKARIFRLLLDYHDPKTHPLSREDYLMSLDSEGNTALHLAASYRSFSPNSERVIAMLCAACPKAISARQHGRKDGLTPMQVCLSVEPNWREEDFSIGWDVNRKGCRVAKSHVEGGYARVVLALSLAGAEALTNEQVDRVIGIRHKTSEIEREKHHKSAIPWSWMLDDDDALREILTNPNVEERLARFARLTRDHDEKVEQARLEAERLKAEANARKIVEAHERKRKGRIVLSLIVAVMAWWWLH